MATVRHPIATVRHPIATVRHPIATVRHPIATVRHLISTTLLLQATIQDKIPLVVLNPSRLDTTPAASRAFPVAEEVEETSVPILDPPAAVTEAMGSPQVATLASVDLDTPMATSVHLASTAPEVILKSRLVAVLASSLLTTASTLDMVAATVEALAGSYLMAEGVTTLGSITKFK